LIADEQSGLLLITQGTLPWRNWQPILGAKSEILVYSFSFVALAFRNGLEYRDADVRIISGLWLQCTKS